MECGRESDELPLSITADPKKSSNKREHSIRWRAFVASVSVAATLTFGILTERSRFWQPANWRWFGGLRWPVPKRSDARPFSRREIRAGSAAEIPRLLLNGAVRSTRNQRPAVACV